MVQDFITTLKAVKFDGSNFDEIREFTGINKSAEDIVKSLKIWKFISIPTIYGISPCKEGDYIMKDMDNNFYIFNPNKLNLYCKE